MLIQFVITCPIDPKGKYDSLTDNQEDALDAALFTLTEALAKQSLTIKEQYWEEI